MENFKTYHGRVPACGVFCGGCPVYIRDKKPCTGAEANPRKCGDCKSFHLCCMKRGIAHCHECSTFPCYRFRKFAGTWLKYGQDLLDNQHLLAEKDTAGFLEYYNGKKI